MRLAHLHLPSLTRYTRASQIQENLIQRHFLYKDSLRSSTPNSPTLIPQPDPTILTFTCHPTYTVGRRYLSPSTTTSTTSSAESKTTYHISPAQRAFLTGLPTPSQTTTTTPVATFHPTPRGGDLTYHGPGQLVAFPLIDLRSHRITPRSYISLLQTTIQRTCALHSVPHTTTTENPGVWMRGGERKICAVGVQVRRGITGHGIALNVRDEEIPKGKGSGRYTFEDAREGGGMLSWGFGRIVACGLEGKSVTWLTREGASADLQVVDVGRTFVEEFARGLGGVEEIYNITEKDVTIGHLQSEIEKGVGANV